MTTGVSRSDPPLRVLLILNALLIQRKKSRIDKQSFAADHAFSKDKVDFWCWKKIENEKSVLIWIQMGQQMCPSFSSWDKWSRFAGILLHFVLRVGKFFWKLHLRQPPLFWRQALEFITTGQMVLASFWPKIPFGGLISFPLPAGKICKKSFPCLTQAEYTLISKAKMKKNFSIWCNFVWANFLHQMTQGRSLTAFLDASVLMSDSSLCCPFLQMMLVVVACNPLVIPMGWCIVPVKSLGVHWHDRVPLSSFVFHIPSLARRSIEIPE